MYTQSDQNNINRFKNLLFIKQRNNFLLQFNKYVLKRNKKYYQKHKDKIFKYYKVDERKYNNNIIDNNLMFILIRDNDNRINNVVKHQNITRNSIHVLTCS